MRIASLLGGFISKKSSVFAPACAGQTGDDVRAKRPPAGDSNGGWKQKGKVPKTLDFIGFSALWMAHPEELESTAYCLGVWHTTSYGIMPDDFQNLKNLETTGFFGRSPYYSVPSGTTLFLLILYRPISKLLASQAVRL